MSPMQPRLPVSNRRNPSSGSESRTTIAKMIQFSKYQSYGGKYGL